MTLRFLKEEYKNSIPYNNGENEQLFDEIDECDNLDDLIKVVGMWAKDAPTKGAERVILERIISE